MNEKKLNFQQQQEHEQETSHRQRRESELAFESTEEMLRHDAAQVEVPAQVAERLAETVRNQPSSGSWWRRLFG